MKANPSPLEIVDFAVINFELNFIPPEKIDDDSRIYWDSYDLDIDFNVSKNDYLRVFIKSYINQQKLPGYKIFAETACIFRFNEKIKISEAEKNSMEGYSTIYIALNCLRGFVSQFTASAPLGRYVLPSVDLNDLIEKKKKELYTEKSTEIHQKKQPAKKSKKLPLQKGK